MYATTHPSLPNYYSSIAGDYFGMHDDAIYDTPNEVFTVIDLLEAKNISWAHYQENMPSAGYLGKSYKNQQNGKNAYVRKHNPGVSFKSVSDNSDRLARIMTFDQDNTAKSDFHRDLNNNKLPQWMFITPNMTSDGHDTDVGFAGRWARNFIDPLLKNKNFMQNTLLLVTWDESESYSVRNQIFGMLLGDAVPSSLVGTEDSSFYNHYTEISSVSANWGLDTLGRWDVGANVFKMVAAKTGDKLRSWASNDEFKSYYWNKSYGGYNNPDSDNQVLPKPNLELDNSVSGRRILPAIKALFQNSDAPTYYSDSIKVNDAAHPPSGYDP